MKERGLIFKIRYKFILSTYRKFKHKEHKCLSLNILSRTGTENMGYYRPSRT